VDAKAICERIDAVLAGDGLPGGRRNARVTQPPTASHFFTVSSVVLCRKPH
jgi:hypothetical protein